MTDPARRRLAWILWVVTILAYVAYSPNFKRERTG